MSVVKRVVSDESSLERSDREPMAPNDLRPTRGWTDAEIADLYALYADRLLRLAYALTRSSADAEDLCHDAFMRALLKWRRGTPHEAFGGWAQTTIVRLFLSRMRASKREMTAWLGLAQQRDDRSEAPVDESLDALAALERLPRRQRAAIVLRYVEDLPVQEIARRMGCRVGTASSLLHQGRARLGMISGNED